ncbi:MAG: ATP-binding cassette domain-containing protein [Candidatus Aenigmarchaeota archaeon]|nr:ATP-binding cassette domain-containing protein [Candidatus Aenigmarchaeota archaeon]
MNILELKNLSIFLSGKKILDKLNINFSQNRIYAIVGLNGAGKSTLAYTIMGLSGYRDIQGDIIFEGRSLKDKTITQRAKKGITLGWQEPARYDGLTIKKFIMLSAKEKNNNIASKVLTQTGLNPVDYLNRAIDKTLSGGERKRIELASILAMKPKLVIFDELDSGIDISSLKRIFDSIKLLKSYGSTIILITHNLEIIKQAGYSFLLCGGKLVLEGNINKIYPYFKNECFICAHKNKPKNKPKNNIK